MSQPTMKLTAEHLSRIASRDKVRIALGANTGADLSQYCGPVFDQQQEGSCTACTTRDYLLWLQKKYGYVPVTDPAVNALYYFARLIYGDESTDGGSTVRDAFQGSITYGVIPSSDESYSESTLFTVPPMQDVVFQASVVKDLTVNTASIRGSLDSGVPVGIGIAVTNTLYSPSVYNGMHIVDKGSIVPNEGHAIFVVAYKVDATHQYLYKFQNSWGTSYGDAGFAWFTEAALNQILEEVCTLDIPATKQPPKPAPLPNTKNNFALIIKSDKTTCTIGETANILVSLTNNGQELVGQIVNVAINGNAPSPLPIDNQGGAGIPWSPSIPGTYNFTATWQSCTASCSVVFDAAKPTPTPTPAPSPDPSDASGGDVSKFQGTVNWSQVKASWVFGIAKVMDGLSPIDPQFSANYAGMQAAGIIRGAYQVGYPLNETGTVAYAAYKKAVGTFELGPILDIEDASCGNATVAQVTQYAVDWLTLGIKDFGYAILYSNENFLNSRIDLSKLPKGTLLWVANYAGEPKLKWTFWQHTDAAKVNGISGSVDTDVFNGSLDALKALIVKEVPPVPQPTPSNLPKDVIGTQWAEVVKWALENKIMFAYGDDTFKPNEPITRGQAAASLMNLYKLIKG